MSVRLVGVGNFRNSLVGCTADAVIVKPRKLHGLPENWNFLGLRMTLLFSSGD